MILYISILVQYSFFRLLTYFLSTDILTKPFQSLARGFFSDFVFLFLFFIPFFLIKLKSRRFLIPITLIVLSLIITINTEQIVVNHDHVNFFFSELAFNKIFILAAINNKRILFFLILALSSFFSSYFLLKNISFKTKIKKNSFTILGLVSLFSLFLIPKEINLPHYMQESVFEFNFFNLISKINKNTKISIGEKRNFIQNHLKKNSIYKSQTSQSQFVKKENVLLIIVEGLSERFIQNDTMPFLKKIAQNNYHLPYFFSLQRQTHRGLYSILCGDLPNLATFTAKSDIIVQNDIFKECLPQILKRSGIKTKYLQAAKLRYMQKDLFLKKIGFDEIYGYEELEKKDIPFSWGLNDEQLYKSAIEEINKSSKQNQNWFISLLTVSTHHPYIVPGGKENDFNSVLKYADKSLDNFIKELNEKGFLKNTLVIITGDEDGGGTNEFVLNNWGFLVAIVPQTPSIKKENSSIFSQIDIFYSILDYLHAPFSIVKDHIYGASFFNPLDETILSKRVHYFANIYQSHFYSYQESSKTLTICENSEGSRCSSLLINKEDLFFSKIDHLQKTQTSNNILDLLEVQSHSDFDYKDFDKSQKSNLDEEIILTKNNLYYLLSNYQINIPERKKFKIDTQIAAPAESQIGIKIYIYFVEKMPYKRIELKKENFRLPYSQGKYTFEYVFENNVGRDGSFVFDIVIVSKTVDKVKIVSLDTLTID